jgi:hypothetical protein
MIPAATIAFRAPKAAGLLALGWAASTLVQPAARADQRANSAALPIDDRVVMMERFVVSTTRIDKNPWRYASLPGFEVLSRASRDDTSWWLDALRRGLRLEDRIMPADWLPPPPVPYTVIIDDTDLAKIQTGPPRSQSIEFRPPDDALTWGQASAKTMVWTDRFEAHDDDTNSINTNVYDLDTRTPAYASISLERLFRCTPPLPRWLLTGLLGQDCGVFRESFILVIDQENPISWIGPNYGGMIQRAEGPGTLWVSLDETKRLLLQMKKDKELNIAVPPLRELFAEAPPSDKNLPLWESEAALFVRWGLMGPGHEDPVLSHAFLELVRRARREPVTENLFTDCFGFGFAAMEEKLGAFLKTALARPISIHLDFPQDFEKGDLKAATMDQIGRILGDWLRMQGNSLRAKDPAMSEEFIKAAGRMLTRAYREDNGLPPDVEPAAAGERTAQPPPSAGAEHVVAMKPFVVTADRIHDPGLLSIYGLYEHDTGNDRKAREFLEAAVRDGVIRPKAWLVLAELRYAEAIGRPEGAGGKLSAQQAASVLEPLDTALQHSSVPEIYSLMLKTWEHCEASPSARDLERIAGCIALFPRQTGLACRAVIVCAKSGDPARTVGLIDRSLVFALPGTERAYLERLRALLVVPAPLKK